MFDHEVLELIQRKAETANLDYKAGFEWTKQNRDLQLELVRDMMAMANTRDGGTIILGVADGSYAINGITAGMIQSLDQTDIGQMLASYADTAVAFEVQKAKVDGKDMVAIRVAEFEQDPVICTQAAFGRDPSKPILRSGAAYIRSVIRDRKS
jgi:predicted HTH transcriptional regulator